MYGIEASKIDLLPLGTYAIWQNTDEVEAARSAIRKRIGASQDSLLIFTGGKLEPWKKTVDLINALRMIHDLDLHLLVAGVVPSRFDDYRMELMSLISSTERVHALGWLAQAELNQAMLACDFAVFPQSQSVLWQQAIGAGLPLIVGETSDQTVAYMNEGNILVLPEEQPLSQAIAAAIRNLTNDPLRRKDMAKISQGLSATALSWSEIARQSLR